MEPSPTINDWHRLADQIGSEHKQILKSTLPTLSFRLLLEAQVRSCKARLSELDLSRDAVEFKERYRSIRLQEDLAEQLLDFVNSFK